MNRCPHEADLGGLLDGTLPAERRTALDEHIEACASCQVRLTELTESEDAERWRRQWADSKAAADSGPRTPPATEPDPVGPAPEAPGYQIVREIGRGGAAVVYLARQLSLKRFVALKILRGSVDPAAVHRFRAEAAAAAVLRHPNIVVIHEVGEHDGLFFLAMEYLEGGTLAQATGRRPIAATEAARLLEPVARALEHSHRAGIIHRDIKPSNILLSPAGDGPAVPRVCDFGLARQLDDDQGLTRTRDLLGTPAYMAPELISDAGLASPRSDVYAVGVVLYELLTGRPPFIGSSPVDTLLQARDREPVAPRQLQSRVPRDIQTICLKCLEKEPLRRYASAGELADDLARFTAGTPVRARPVSAAAQAFRWARRHRALAATSAGLALTLLVGFAASVVAAGYFRRMANEMTLLAEDNDRARRRAVAAQEASERQRETTLRNLYLTRANLTGQSLGATDRAVQIERFFRECGGLKTRDDPRGWEWRYFTALSRRAALTLRGHDADVLAIAWRPDGRQIASAGFDRTLRFWDGVTGRQVAAAPAGWGVRAISWSGDGALLAAAGSDNAIRIHDGSTGRELRSIPCTGRAAAWNPRSAEVAGIDESAVVIWTVDGARVTMLAGHDARPTTVAWNADGSLLASGDPDGQIIVWDAVARKRLHALSTGSPVIAIRFSPDGRRLAASHNPSRVSLWNAADGTPVRDWPGHSRPAFGVDFSADGATLATGSDDSTIKLWDSASGRELQTLYGHTHHVSQVAFRPGGEWIATANAGWNGEIKLWRIGAPPNPRSAPLAAGPEASVRWSADGRQLLVGDRDGLRRLNPDDLTVSRSRRGPSFMEGSISPDGLRWAATEPGKGLVVADADSELIRLLDGDIDARLIAWSPDGSRVAVSDPSPDRPFRNRARIFDVSSGRLLHTTQAAGVAWSPDGAQIAFGDAYLITLVDATTFQTVRTWSTPIFLNDQLRFHPSGRWMAAAFHNTVIVYDAATGRAERQLFGHGANVRAVRWSPDGERIATAGDDRTVRLWDNATGQLILTLAGPPGPVNAVAWSPDGLQIAGVGAGRVCLWDARDGDTAEPRRPLTDDAGAAPLTPTGWWAIDPDQWRPGEDPFADAADPPRWYHAADDPNGYFPVANRPLMYLTRVLAPTRQPISIETTGLIRVQLWWGGKPWPAAGAEPVVVEAGWHTLAVVLAAPDAQADAITRPRAGIGVRITAAPTPLR